MKTQYSLGTRQIKLVENPMDKKKASVIFANNPHIHTAILCITYYKF